MGKKIFTTTFFLISFAFLVMIVYFLFFYDFGEGRGFFKKEEETTQKSAQGNVLIQLDNKSVGNNNTGSQAIGGQGSDKIELDVERLSSSFAERFGSYSNQSDFRNVTGLKIFMTDKMKAWSADYVEKLRNADNLDASYYGITTKAVAVKVLEYDEALGTAKVVVSTRRAEAADMFENTTNVFNQDLTLYLLKLGSDWKVDSVAWSDL